MAESQTRPTRTARTAPPIWRLAGLLILAWAGLLIAGYLVGGILTAARADLDASMVEAFLGPRTGGLTSAMRAITWLGSPVWLDVVFAGALAALVLRRAWRSAVFLALASPGTVLMIQLVKTAVARRRPPGLHLTPAEGLSWPSGHASSSTALYGALLLIVLGSGEDQQPASALRSQAGGRDGPRADRDLPRLPRRPLPIRRARRLAAHRRMADRAPQDGRPLPAAPRTNRGGGAIVRACCGPDVAGNVIAQPRRRTSPATNRSSCYPSAADTR